MIETFNPLAESERKKLLALVLFRILTITILLGATLFLNFRSGKAWTPVQHILMYAIGVTYLLSIFFLLAIKHNTSYHFQAIAQIFWDVLFWSCLVYVTQGLHSPFTFLYALSIIQGSVLLGKEGTISTTAFSVFSFIVVVWFERYMIFHQYLGLSPSFTYLWQLSEIYHFFLTVCMFVLISIMASYLTRQIESREEKLSSQTLSLEMQKMLNRSIVAGINSGFIMIDLDGIVTFFNVAAERISGIANDDARDRSLDEIFPGLAESLKRELNGDDWGRFVEIPLSPSGENPRWANFSFSDLLGPNNQRMGSIVILDETTGRRRLEERVFRSEKLAAVGSLAAGIAHEIRNPLASISGSIQILRGELPAGEDNEKLAEIILRETDRLNGLINDFLAYARPNPPLIVPVNLREILEDINELLLGESQNREIRLRVEFGEHTPELLADAGQVRQMLWNILKNAADAVREKSPGVIWVKIAGQQTPEGAAELVFNVQDNGKGMDEATITHMYDPFFTTKRRGTGLGMSIVYQIVQAHGGRIDVESTPGEGTRFVIALPIRPAEAAVAVGG